MFFGLNVAAIYCDWCQAGTLCSGRAVIWVWVVCFTAAFIGAQRVRLGPSGSEKTEQVKYSCQRLWGAWLKQEVIIIPAWAFESLKYLKEVWIMAQYVFNPFSARMERKDCEDGRGASVQEKHMQSDYWHSKCFGFYQRPPCFPKKNYFFRLETWTKDTIF